MRSSIRVRQACAGVALVAAVGLATPAIAAADPIPSADPLAQAVLQLENTPNADQDSLTAARAVLGAGVADAAGPLDAYNQLVEVLARFGVQAALWPSVSPLCDDTAGLPLDTAPAMAGAAPGKWPGDVPILGEIKLVDPGEVLFAFVPVGLDASEDTSGMQVAWININTLKGGFVPMGGMNPIIDEAYPPITIGNREFPNPRAVALKGLLGSVPGSGGIRAVPVKTDKGTVLSATFGTVQNGERTCFFLPTVGITEVE